MKFLTSGGVTKIRGNQTKARSCYMNVLRKAAKREEASSTVMMVLTKPMDVDPEQAGEEMMLDEDLDPRIIGPDSSASPVKDLETYHVNPSNLIQMLQVGQKLGE
ncbi:Uncharacterized protein Adt_26571 [Abeliophyllum distichum]|uniref:Uncharacterized protein n=1 Tax=Abeliophyllum distichum TaxID=126358 RepID=A0ABD1RT53_9LAMI